MTHDTCRLCHHVLDCVLFAFVPHQLLWLNCRCYSNTCI